MDTKKIKKHFFFDMDGTATESQQVISKEIREYLQILKSKEFSIVIVSGAAKEQVLKQLAGTEVDYILAQSGNDSPFWQKLFT